MLGSTMRHHRLTKKHLYTQAALYAGASKELGPFIILSFYFIYICRYFIYLHSRLTSIISLQYIHARLSGGVEPTEGINLSQSCHDRAHTDGVPETKVSSRSGVYIKIFVKI